MTACARPVAGPGVVAILLLDRAGRLAARERLLDVGDLVVEAADEQVRRETERGRGHVCPDVRGREDVGEGERRLRLNARSRVRNERNEDNTEDGGEPALERSADEPRLEQAVVVVGGLGLRFD